MAFWSKLLCNSKEPGDSATYAYSTIPVEKVGPYHWTQTIGNTRLGDPTPLERVHYGNKHHHKKQPRPQTGDVFLNYGLYY